MKVPDRRHVRFLVVTRRRMKTSAFEDLAVLHAALPARLGHWGGHLEGSYPVADELATLDGVGKPWAYVDHGSRVLEAASLHCNTPVTRRILRDHGITLKGPPARDLVEPVPDDVIREYSREQLADTLQDFNSWSARDAWSQRYAVVTVARLLCSIETGQVVSKPVAAQWVGSHHDPQWRPLLEHIVSTRGTTPYADPPDPDWIDQTRAFGTFAQTSLPTS